MSGTVYRRGSTWTFQVTVGTKRTGRRHHSRGGFRTQREAKRALAKFVVGLGQGDNPVIPKRTDLSVGEWLSEWLEACQVRTKRPLKPTTAAGYGNAIDIWIVPHVGSIRLRDLDRDQLVRLYATLSKSGGVDGRPLGSRSVQLVHTILTKSLKAAVTRDLIEVSPVDRIPDDDRPTHTRKKRDDQHWSPEQARVFLESVAQDRLYPLWALALDSGARRGELAALRWSDVDLDGGRVSITKNRVMAGAKVLEGTPKSDRSSRVIDVHGETVAVLRRWKTRQMRERMAAGSAGDRDCYLFTNELGVPYRPDGLSYRFNKARLKSLPPISFHGLRHTSGTILLAAGEALHVVSERLGHSSTAITSDVYAHVLREQGTQAASRIGAALYGSTER